MDIEKKKQELCLSCLECCKSLVIPFDYNRLSKEDIEFYKIRGIDFITTYKSSYMILNNFPCPYLTKNGCSIYNSRPKVCNDYDGREDYFLKDECEWNKLR